MGPWGRSLVFGSLLLLAPLVATGALAATDEPLRPCMAVDCSAASLPEEQAPALPEPLWLEALHAIRFDSGASAPESAPEAATPDLTLPTTDGQAGDDDVDGDAQEDEAPRHAPEPHGGDGRLHGSDATSARGGHASADDSDAEAAAEGRGEAALALTHDTLDELPDRVEHLAAPLDAAEARLRDALGWVQEMRLSAPALPALQDEAPPAPAATTAHPHDDAKVAPTTVAIMAGVAFLGGAALASVGALGSTMKTLAGRAHGLLRRFGWLLAAPLFTKITKSDALDHPLRDQVVDAVRHEPGITVQELRARFGIGYGTVVHHIRILEHHRIVSSVREGRHRRVFLVGQLNHSDRPKAALLANPKTGRIYRLLADRPGLSQSDLAQEVNVRESTVHWHVTRLQEAGLVETRRRGRKVHYFPLTSDTPDLAAS